MTEPETTVTHWVDVARKNISEFERSPVHDLLLTPRREAFTELYEKDPERALKLLRTLLYKAVRKESPGHSISRIEAPWGCWELSEGKGKSKPSKTDAIGGMPDYCYRVILHIVLGLLPCENTFVRHQCDNRLCIRPDHLLLGSAEENDQDELRRVYSGRGAKGKQQTLDAEISMSLEESSLHHLTRSSE